MVATIANIDVVQAPFRLHGLCFRHARVAGVRFDPFRSRTTMTSTSAIACNLEAGAGVRSRFSHGLGIDRAQCGTSAASACVLLCGVLRRGPAEAARGPRIAYKLMCARSQHTAGVVCTTRAPVRDVPMNN